MGFDFLKIVLAAGVISVVIAAFCSGYVAWLNAGSRNLALATGTLAAAILLFLIQLRFELRTFKETDFITAELTVDRAKPQIRQWVYPHSAGPRVTAEVYASDWLRGKNSSLFQGDRERLTRDMVIFSIVHYFVNEQFDWQLKRDMFRAYSSWSIIHSYGASGPQECTRIDEGALRQKLRTANNVFDEAPIGGTADLCLPPDTRLTLTGERILIENPFCVVSIRLELSGSINYTKPNTGGEVPTLKNGEQQYETRLTGLRVETKYSWIRAHHSEMGKYKEWVDRVVKGLRGWFEGLANRAA
jgi:hypothetical protein